MHQKRNHDQEAVAYKAACLLLAIVAGQYPQARLVQIEVSGSSFTMDIACEQSLREDQLQEWQQAVNLRVQQSDALRVRRLAWQEALEE